MTLHGCRSKRVCSMHEHCNMPEDAKQLRVRENKGSTSVETDFNHCQAKVGAAPTKRGGKRKKRRKDAPSRSTLWEFFCPELHITIIVSTVRNLCSAACHDKVTTKQHSKCCSELWQHAHDSCCKILIQWIEDLSLFYVKLQQWMACLSVSTFLALHIGSLSLNFRV